MKYVLSEDQRRDKNEKYLIRYRRRMRWINFLKVKKGCQVCGYNTHPAALDFDHLEPSTKLFHITTGLMRNLKKVFAEIRKCRLICANCHRVHTREQHAAGLIQQRRKNELALKP